MTRLSQLDTNLLVALDLLLRECSVTRAAQQMGVTQSAMSQTLSRLRDLLEDPLLTRSGNTMEPTPKAELLAPPLRAALRDLEAVLSLAPAFDPAQAKREFSVGATDYVALLLVRPLMVKLAQQAPGVAVRVVPLGRNITQPLEEGEADLVLSVLLDMGARMKHRVLYRESYRCLMRHDHPLAQVSPQDKERWLDHYCAAGHVLVGRTGRGLGRVGRTLAQEGRTRRVMLRVPYFLAAAPVVSSTNLVLTLPSRAALIFAAEDPDLIVSQVPLELPTFAVASIWHERYDRDPGLSWLRSAVDSVIFDLEQTFATRL
ncbi:MAG: LysR family transcriptional regulator [Myxococcota bacterium]